MAYDKKEISDRIADSLLRRAVSSRTESGIGRDPVFTGLYAAARLSQAEVILVIVTNRIGKAVSELMLPDSLLLNPEELALRIRTFCLTTGCRKVILSMHKDDDRSVPLKAAIYIRLSEELEADGISICGYFLIDGFDFENLVL